MFFLQNAIVNSRRNQVFLSYIIIRKRPSVRNIATNICGNDRTGYYKLFAITGPRSEYTEIIGMRQVSNLFFRSALLQSIYADD